MYNIFKVKDKKIAVINAMGRVEINIMTDSPFVIVNEIIEKIKNDVDITILDFHAEATAEKKAMGHYLDGKISIIFGTHTHVQTADEEILEKGTAYITDIGMIGPKNSIIGMDTEVALKRFLTALPEKYKVATGDAIFNSVMFKINDETNKVEEIRRFFI